MRFALTTLSVLLFSFCYAQNFGIGTTTPAAPLHLVNNGPELFRMQGNDPYLSFFNFSGTGKGFIQSHGNNLNLGTYLGNTSGLIQFFNNNNLNMVVHPNSNVGIGTNEPFFKLTVQTANDNYGIVHRSNDIIVGTWIGANSGGFGGWYGTFTNHPLMFFTNNGGPQITLLQNGNTGIGTNGPSFKLTVQTANDNYGLVHRSNDIIVGSWIGANAGITGGWYGTYTNHPLSFFTNNGSPQITLLQNGNTGIGTINPIAKLHIAADGEALRLSGTNPYLTLYQGASLKGYIWSKGANDVELGTDDSNPNGSIFLSIQEVPRLTVQSDGRVRVGPIASTFSIPIPAYDRPNFTVNGVLALKIPVSPFDEWAIAPALDAGTQEGILVFFKNGSARSYIDDDGDWISLSDASLKQDIKIFRPVLPQITKLQVSTYRFKWNSDRDPSFGLIAQNVNEYFPEIVSENTDKDGKRLLAISYAKTGVLAIKAIQEQQQIIETQQKTIEIQQKLIESQQMKTHELEKRLAMLESKLN